MIFFSFLIIFFLPLKKKGMVIIMEKTNVEKVLELLKSLDDKSKKQFITYLKSLQESEDNQEPGPSFPAKETNITQ